MRAERAGGPADWRTGGPRLGDKCPPGAGGLVRPSNPISPAESPAAEPPSRRAPGWQLQDGLWVRAREGLERCLGHFRRVVGMPDYAAYVDHLRVTHPSWPVPSEGEFFDLYLRARYGDGPTRCC